MKACLRHGAIKGLRPTASEAAYSSYFPYFSLNLPPLWPARALLICQTQPRFRHANQQRTSLSAVDLVRQDETFVREAPVLVFLGHQIGPRHSIPLTPRNGDCSYVGKATCPIRGRFFSLSPQRGERVGVRGAGRRNKCARLRRATPHPDPPPAETAYTRVSATRLSDRNRQQPISIGGREQRRRAVLRLPLTIAPMVTGSSGQAGRRHQ